MSGLQHQHPNRRPALWATLAAVLVMAVTASLGRWQLGRAAEKEALQAQRVARQGLPAVGWDALRDAVARGASDQLYDRTVLLTGRWVPEATVFLDNRPMNGRAGFFVVTPLQLGAGGPAVAILRGWVPRRTDDRTALPAVPVVTREVTVRGRLAPPPSKLYELGETGVGVIRQNIDVDRYGAE